MVGTLEGPGNVGVYEPPNVRPLVSLARVRHVGGISDFAVLTVMRLPFLDGFWNVGGGVAEPSYEVVPHV